MYEYTNRTVEFRDVDSVPGAQNRASNPVMEETTLYERLNDG